MLKYKFVASAFAFALALTAVGLTTPAVAQIGPPGGTIYAHDMAYKTVATPTDLPSRGKFDAIYVLGDGFAPVSEAAPGDMDYNGGRWEVHLVTFTGVLPMQYTNAEDILAAASRGDIEIGDVVKRFQCPLVRN